MSTLRTYAKAVDSGNTNITRVLTKLMQYPAKWQGNQNQISAAPLSPFVEGEFSAPGRMTPDEIRHIVEEWPVDQKNSVRDAVLGAISGNRPMVFKWGLTSGPVPVTDIVADPDDPPTVPILVTFLSPRSGVTFSGGDESDDDYVTIVTPLA